MSKLEELIREIVREEVHAIFEPEAPKSTRPAERPKKKAVSRSARLEPGAFFNIRQRRQAFC